MLSTMSADVNIIIFRWIGIPATKKFNLGSAGDAMDNKKARYSKRALLNQSYLPI
jgi:predicted phosphoribosyltransferase